MPCCGVSCNIWLCQFKYKLYVYITIICARVTAMWVSSRLMWLYVLKLWLMQTFSEKLKEMQKVLQPSPLSPIDEEKSLRSWMENVQIILNTQSTLCLLFICFYAPLYYLLLACMFWTYTSLKFLTYNCFKKKINL